MFDMFPDNPQESWLNGVDNLKASFDEVLGAHRTHAMPLQRYDVLDRIVNDGSWVEKHWLPINRPVVTDTGELVYVLHEVRDITRHVFMTQWLNEQEQINSEAWRSVERMRVAVNERGKALAHARTQIERDMAERNSWSPSVVDELHANLGAPDMRLYMVAGDRVPKTGYYHVFHASDCISMPFPLPYREGTRFPACQRCGPSLLYREWRPPRTYL